MAKFLIDFWMDGYDSEEEMIEACKEYIIDQLDFSASQIKILQVIPDEIEDPEEDEKGNPIDPWKEKQ